MLVNASVLGIYIGAIIAIVGIAVTLHDSKLRRLGPLVIIGGVITIAAFCYMIVTGNVVLWNI